MTFWAVGLGGQPFQITSVPTGRKPMGLAVMGYGSVALSQPTEYLVVANSGDDSASIYSFDLHSADAPQLVTVVKGIRDPHAVIRDCGDGAGIGPSQPFRFVISSPSDNSVSFVRVAADLSTSIARVAVGANPVSLGCYWVNGKGLVAVSNYGDQTVTVIDGGAMTVTATIAGVPGSPGLHGVGGVFTWNETHNPVPWVVGTDANVVTLLDLAAGKVVTQFPLQQPLAIQGTQIDTASAVLSFDPATLQPSTVLGLPGIQLYEASDGSRLGTFALATASGTAALDLVSGTGLLPFSQAQGPQDMILRQTQYCMISANNRSCFAYDSQVLATSSGSDSLVAISAADLPHDFSIYSAAVPLPVAAPGSLVSIYVETGAAQVFTAGSAPLPPTLGNVTIRMGGSVQTTPSSWVYSPEGSIQAALLYVGPSQINFQVPPGIAPGDTVPIQLQKADGTTLLTEIRVTATAPAVFTLDPSQSRGAVLNQDYSANSPSNPAQRGSVIQIFGTGGGDTTPRLAPGEAAPANGNPLVTTNVQPAVSLWDGKANLPLTVTFSGLAPGLAGVWQINAVVPQNVTPGDVGVTVTTTTSSNIFQVAVQ